MRERHTCNKSWENIKALTTASTSMSSVVVLLAGKVPDATSDFLGTVGRELRTAAMVAGLSMLASSSGTAVKLFSQVSTEVAQTGEVEGVMRGWLEYTVAGGVMKLVGGLLSAGVEAVDSIGKRLPWVPTMMPPAAYPAAKLTRRLDGYVLAGQGRHGVRSRCIGK